MTHRHIFADRQEIDAETGTGQEEWKITLEFAICNDCAETAVNWD
jgi:hypothetical protein